MSKTPSTPNHRRLRRWIAASHGRGSSLAGSLGVSRQAVFFWSSGVSRPRPELRERIADLTGGKVPAEAWQSAPARRAA